MKKLHRDNSIALQSVGRVCSVSGDNALKSQRCMARKYFSVLEEM